MMLRGKVNRLAAGLGLSEDGDVGLGGQQGFEALAHDGVVIDKQDGYILHNGLVCWLRLTRPVSSDSQAVKWGETLISSRLRGRLGIRP
jgi:hypothetical protein